jgi:hypothetical protein
LNDVMFVTKQPKLGNHVQWSKLIQNLSSIGARTGVRISLFLALPPFVAVHCPQSAGPPPHQILNKAQQCHAFLTLSRGYESCSGSIGAFHSPRKQASLHCWVGKKLKIERVAFRRELFAKIYSECGIKNVY